MTVSKQRGTVMIYTLQSAMRWVSFLNTRKGYAKVSVHKCQGGYTIY